MMMRKEEEHVANIVVSRSDVDGGDSVTRVLLSVIDRHREKTCDRVIQTRECWRVSRVKRSLFSLSILDSQGYRFHARPGVLSVRELEDINGRLDRWILRSSRECDCRGSYRYRVKES